MRTLVAVAGAALLASSSACAEEASLEDLPAQARADERAEDRAAPVAYEDHWHAAFGVYVCDGFLPATPEFEGTDGIHTHGDAVIHIHPFTGQAAGDNARLSLYLDGAGIEVSDDELRVDGRAYAEGDDTCGGEEGEVVVLRWADVRAGDAEAERVDTNARFRSDGEGYVVAYVPSGTEVPKPESVALLDDLMPTGSSEASGSTGPSTSEEGPSEDEAPVDTDERSLGDGFYVVEDSEPAPCRTPGMRPDPAGESCYRLGDEPTLGTDIIEDAVASEAQSVSGEAAWQVDLTLGAGGIDAFNDVAAECFRLTAACPSGRLALVVDDEIVTAPTIAAESFARDEISVSGNFTEDEARSVAEQLR